MTLSSILCKWPGLLKERKTIVKKYRKLVYRQNLVSNRPRPLDTDVFIARYITLYIESSSGKLYLFRVTFFKDCFYPDELAL